MILHSFSILLFVLVFLTGRANAQAYLVVDPEEVAVWDGYHGQDLTWIYTRLSVLLLANENGWRGRFFALGGDAQNGYVPYSIDADITWNDTFSCWEIEFTAAATSQDVTLYLEYEEPPEGVASAVATHRLNYLPNPGPPPHDQNNNSEPCGDDNLDLNTHPIFGYGQALEVLRCAKMRVVIYNGNGGDNAFSVNVDLGDVEDAYDKTQSAGPHSFAQDSFDNQILDELHPAPYTSFLPGTEKLPVEFTFTVPGGEETADLSIDLSDLSVTADGEVYTIFGQQENLSTFKVMVRTVTLALMTLGFIVLYIRSVRHILGG